MTEPFVTFRWLDLWTGDEIGTVSFSAQEWDRVMAILRRLPEDVRHQVLRGEARIDRCRLEDLPEVLAAGGRVIPPSHNGGRR